MADARNGYFLPLALAFELAGDIFIRWSLKVEQLQETLHMAGDYCLPGGYGCERDRRNDLLNMILAKKLLI